MTEETKAKKVKQLKKPFLIKKVLKLFKRPVKELTKPILILIKENGEAKIYEGVESGDFHIKTDKGEEKIIVLSNSKLLSLQYGGEEYPAWIAYENEATAYPTEIIRDSRTLAQLLRAIANENKELKSAEIELAKYKGIAIILAVIFLAVYLLYTRGAFNGLFAAKTAVHVAQNTSNVIIS